MVDVMLLIIPSYKSLSFVDEAPRRGTAGLDWDSCDVGRSRDKPLSWGLVALSCS